MPTKDDVAAILREVLPPDLAELWWDLRLPRLGNKSPNQAWAEGHENLVYDRAKGYLEVWFG